MSDFSITQRSPDNFGLIKESKMTKTFTRTQNDTIMEHVDRSTPVKEIARMMFTTEDRMKDHIEYLKKVDILNDTKEGCETYPPIDTNA